MADIRSYAPASRALGPRPGFALIVARRGRRRRPLRGGSALMRERHGLAAASSAQPGLGVPPRSGSCGTVVEARWLRAGTGASAKPGPGPQWIHVNGDRPIRVGFFQGDAQRGDRGGGEVALWIALAAQVEVIFLGPKEATPAKVSLDPPDRTLQHIAHFAGLQMSKARKERAAWPRATSSLPFSCQAPSRAIVCR